MMQTFIKSSSKIPSNLLLTFQRNISETTKKKRLGGEVVKRLNKENKCLFGNLLESRSERRKSVTNSIQKLQTETVTTNQVLPYGGREVNEIDVNLCPRAEKSWIRVSGESVVSNPGTNTLQKIDPELSCNSTFEAVVNPPQDKSSSAIIPKVVLKSIQGFPLINRNKSVNLKYSLESQEALASRNRDYSKLYPSVSKILNATMSDVSKVLLKKWREKMISLLGEGGFLKFYKAQLNAGIQFHSAIQSFLRGTSEERLVLDGQGVAGSWESLSPVISEITGIQMLEGAVCHPHLFYHGVADCIASYQGEPVLIEWKKSDKPKPTLEKTYDAPIQLSAYIGAMNYDQNYPLQVNGGLVVVAYSDGSPADVFHLSLAECNKYWKSWLERVQLFWLEQQKNDKLTPDNLSKE